MRKLKLNTAGRRVNVTFLMTPGEEIAVADERADELLRRYGHLVEASAKAEPKGAVDADATPARKVATKPARKAATKPVATKPAKKAE